MNNSNGALRPEVFSSIPEYVKQEKRVVDMETLTDEEKILAAGAINEFWQILRRRFEDEMITLDRIAESTMSEGKTFEEIGRTALVVNHVKGVVNRIIGIVEDAREAVEQHGETV